MGAIAVVASLHLDTAAPNAFVQEQVLYTTEGTLRYVENPGLFDVMDGYFDVPDGPGPDVDIDEETVDELDGADLEFERPVGRRADGSVGKRGRRCATGLFLEGYLHRPLDARRPVRE